MVFQQHTGGNTTHAAKGRMLEVQATGLVTSWGGGVPAMIQGLPLTLGSLLNPLKRQKSISLLESALLSPPNFYAIACLPTIPIMSCASFIQSEIVVGAIVSVAVPLNTREWCDGSESTESTMRQQQNRVGLAYTLEASYGPISGPRKWLGQSLIERKYEKHGSHKHGMKP
jgi:hypothetical protein